MSFRGPTYQDILNSPTASAMPGTATLQQTDTRNYFQAIDSFDPGEGWAPVVDEE